MNNTLVPHDIESSTTQTSLINELFDKGKNILQEHRLKDPDFYRMLEEQRIIKASKIAKKELTAAKVIATPIEMNTAPKLPESICLRQYNQDQLKITIAINQKIIREDIATTQSVIVPRTQARNAKQPHDSIESMMADRADKLASQIKAWRSLLPVLINRFAKIKDPRRAKSVKHQLAVVMLYGLFAFIFRLSSRREMNRELTGIVIFENLRKIFPELVSHQHSILG